MPTTLFRKLLLSGTILILLASCAKTNKQGKLIPKEAAIVITLDGKSLSAKLPWEEIKKNPLFQSMSSDSTMPAALKSLLDNPETSGMDISSDCILFAVKDSLGGYLGFEGSVKDEAAFKTFNKQVSENGAESEKDGVQFISKFPVCVGWTKERFVYIFDAPQIGQMDDLTRRMLRDSINVRPVSSRDIGATCKAVFALPESNSLAKNENFTSLMKETGDVLFWMNSEELMKGGSTASAMAMVNLDKFYKGNVTSATMNFENGKMSIKATTYAIGEIIDLVKKYGGGKINEEMIKRMPGKDVVALMALNFKPEGLAALVKMTGMDGLINIGLKNMNFTLEDFIKANKGDILVGVSDLVTKPDTSTFQFQEQEPHVSISQKPSFNFVFSSSIGDKDAFNKLINAGKKLGGQFGDSSKAPIAYNSDANWFVMSNTQQNADRYLASAAGSFDFIDKIGGEPFGGYINFQLLLKAFGAEASKDSAARIAYDATLSMWDNMTWKGGNYSNGGIQQTAEINLVDKSTNSLKQLNTYAAKLSELYKDRKRKQSEETMAYEDYKSAEDSTIAAPKSK
jgi:hypothetical protein